MDHTLALTLCPATCTDQTWGSDSCAQYCRNTPSLTTWGDVRQCDNSISSWVCGQDPSDCSNNFTIPPGYINDKRPATQSGFLALPSVYTAAAQATETVTKTVTGTHADTGTATSSCNNTAVANGTLTCGKDNSTTVGLAAGLGAGIPLLVLLVASLMILFRERKHVKRLQQQLRHGANGAGPHYEKDGRTIVKNSGLLTEVQGRQIYEAPFG